jgi:hypothetical protein
MGSSFAPEEPVKASALESTLPSTDLLTKKVEDDKVPVF